MYRIACNVTNCSHNKNEICYANRINVSGGNANNSVETNCASFLDNAHYSDLTSNTNNPGEECKTIVCDVQSCAYNDNTLCHADSIKVSGGESHLYEETNCSTFKDK
ncbi:DUF1540 domain-containing protein [Clostridium thailandense]|uniref:DUF1540 domain-containing protein n=1 Tax=Clostridium thailandense TaxID=2794346 RepID=A0A949TR97_9CLOT|nr:DUF1540 domain-containing protein [Clostridium thailandense]MBV7271826.1 DUF1540 domain-containing protein [Clostridium thailandense]MCH5135622.1 DUF1540 domain-containing protein [Clostridiaceae bacterium UIB06]